MGNSSWNNLDKSFKIVMCKVVDHIVCIYGHFFRDCPSSFYSQNPLLHWGKFNTFFLFQGSRVVFEFRLQEDQQSIVVCIGAGCCSIFAGVGRVVWLTTLPISNWKGKTRFCGFLVFCCCSILTVLQHLHEQYWGYMKMK